ncbi:DUF5667 domain-containing protein [Amycolatopsis sp. 195334CR]|uniref:DUF5667 domain-containing protein n=1 Tax=Amycolatopsis sp. 195334CR TaxID=2814588 RepID=UPI001A8FEE22|nr:DUF5667 domain-containing protein [Amycolatopsis sp. 195334CR]MBN6036110.1 hypothetical protein [Amycolatopsis sp. 195334CR]
MKLPWERERDRFARAVEDPSPDDDEFRHELDLVGQLRRLGNTATPGPETRERIAAAIEARPVVPPPRRRTRWGPVIAGGLAGLIGIGGLGVALAGDALPGDSLYGMKLAGETATVGLTFDDEARAGKRLDHAGGRLAELRELGGRDAAEFRATLDSFGQAAREGTAELTAVATGTSGAQLTGLRSWAAEQARVLADLRPSVPEGASVAFDNAVVLMDRVDRRAAALAERMSCYQITSGKHDDLGALPATAGCGDGSPPPAVPADPGAPADPDDPALVPVDRPESPTVATPPVDDRPITATPVLVAPSLPAPPVTEAPPPVTRPRPPIMPPPPGELLRLPPLLPGLPEVRVGW